MNLLCISDIHLGSPVCKTDFLIELLNSKDWSEIVINGDLIDNGHFKRYSKQHWEVLKLLRKKSKTIPVRLIEGNHDQDSRVLCEILGLEFLPDYKLEIDERKIIFMHGHQFDGFISKHPLITNLASNIYYFIQLFDKNCKITGRIKKTSKSWLNASKIVSDRAIRFAKENGYTDIVCGHVHQSKVINQPDEPIYWNTGTFCETPSHYFEIDYGNSNKISLKSLD